MKLKHTKIMFYFPVTQKGKKSKAPTTQKKTVTDTITAKCNHRKKCLVGKLFKIV